MGNGPEDGTGRDRTGRDGAVGGGWGAGVRPGSTTFPRRKKRQHRRSGGQPGTASAWAPVPPAPLPGRAGWGAPVLSAAAGVRWGPELEGGAAGPCPSLLPHPRSSTGLAGQQGSGPWPSLCPQPLGPRPGSWGVCGGVTREGSGGAGAAPILRPYIEAETGPWPPRGLLPQGPLQNHPQRLAFARLPACGKADEGLGVAGGWPAGRTGAAGG